MEIFLSGRVEVKRGSFGEWNKRFAQVNSNSLWISVNHSWVYKDVYNLLEYTIHHFPDSQQISFLKKCGALENLNALDSFTIRLKEHSNWFNHLQILSAELQLQADRTQLAHNGESFHSDLIIQNYQNSLLSEFESDISRKETEQLIENLFFRFPPHQKGNFTAFSDEIMHESEIEKIITKQIKQKLDYQKVKAIFSNLVLFFSSNLFCKWIECSLTTITAILYFLSVNYCLVKETNKILLSFQTPEIHAFTLNPIQVFNRFSVNSLLRAFKKYNNSAMNSKLIIIERERNQKLELFLKNELFSAVYIVQIKTETDFTVQIYTNNLRFMPSMIDNIRNNYEQKKGIWSDEDNSSLRIPIVTPLNALLNIYASFVRNINHSEFKELIEDIPFELIIFIILTFVYEFQIDFSNKGILFSFFNLALLKLFIQLTLRSSNLLISLAYKVQQMQTNYSKENLQNYSINLINRSNFESLVFLPKQEEEFNKIFSLIGCVLTVFDFQSFFYFASVMSIPLIKPYYTKLFVAERRFTFPAIFIGILLLFLFSQTKRNRSKSLNLNNQKNIKIIECGICLETILIRKQSTMFKCKNGHAFHSNCITKWKESDSNNMNRQQCPVCRVSIISQSQPMTQ